VVRRLNVRSSIRPYLSPPNRAKKFPDLVKETRKHDGFDGWDVIDGVKQQLTTIVVEAQIPDPKEITSNLSEFRFCASHW